MLTTNRTYLEVRTDKQRTTLKAVRCGALRYFYPARRNPNQTIDARSSPQSSFAACLPFSPSRFLPSFVSTCKNDSVYSVNLYIYMYWTRDILIIIRNKL